MKSCGKKNRVQCYLAPSPAPLIITADKGAAHLKISSDISENSVMDVEEAALAGLNLTTIHLGHNNFR